MAGLGFSAEGDLKVLITDHVVTVFAILRSVHDWRGHTLER